ncbi:PASTA domain-containing protein [bacterium]|nr:PASTA domain-containing protein [bacterium]
MSGAERPLQRALRIARVVGAMLAITLLGVWVANRWLLPRQVGVDEAFPMPVLEGSSKEEVYSLCARKGLVLSERPPEFDASLPAGYLLRQHPAAGTQIKAGRRVTAVFSAGPRMVAVPDLRGQSERQARLSLEDLGLLPGDILRSPGDQPAGGILSTRPGPGARVTLGARVDLLLSDGDGSRGFLMPDLTRKPLDTALALLADAGLGKPQIRYRSAPGRGAGSILAQTPAAGTRLEKGDAIELVVASRSD